MLLHLNDWNYSVSCGLTFSPQHCWYIFFYLPHIFSVEDTVVRPEWCFSYDQTYSCLRDLRLSASWGPSWRLPLKPLEQHSTMVLRCLMNFYFNSEEYDRSKISLLIRNFHLESLCSVEPCLKVIQNKRNFHFSLGFLQWKILQLCFSSAK